MGRIESLGRLLLGVFNSSGSRMASVAADDQDDDVVASSKSRSETHVLLLVLRRRGRIAGGDAMNDDEDGRQEAAGGEFTVTVVNEVQRRCGRRLNFFTKVDRLIIFGLRK